MKKAALALIILSASAMASAAPQSIVYKAEWGGTTKTFNAIQGTPASSSSKAVHQESVCNFKNDLGSSSFKIEDSEGASIVVIPDQITEVGIKTAILFSKDAAFNQKRVALASGNCTIPTGEKNSVGLNTVDVLMWGKTASYKLADGTVLKITATKDQ
jgi:hypothetical protein